MRLSSSLVLLLWINPYHSNNIFGRAFQACPSYRHLVVRGSPTTTQIDSESLLYQEQENLLVNRGEVEEKLMAGNQSPLEAHTPKGAGSSGGFGGGGGGGKANSKSLKEAAKAHAKVLKTEGVVRIDNVLSADIADKMREYVYSLRQESEELVEAGEVKGLDVFSNVLLRSNRCDLKIPLGPEPVMLALKDVLSRSAVGATIEKTFNSKKAVLYELASMISDPGSQRQVIHPDNPVLQHMPNEPTLLTCFIALQDIEMSMGPTVFMPKTHTPEVHEHFKDDQPAASGEESPKDRLLRTTPTVLGLLPKGCCTVYDSRLLHCGSANKSEEGKSRALFYFSFKNPKVGYPGNPASIRSELGQAQMTIKDLTKHVDSWGKETNKKPKTKKPKKNKR